MGHFALEAIISYNKGQECHEGKVRILHTLDFANRTIHCIDEKNRRVNLRIEDRSSHAMRKDREGSDTFCSVVITRLILRKSDTNWMVATCSRSKHEIMHMVSGRLQEIKDGLMVKIYRGTPKSQIRLGDVVLTLNVERIFSPGTAFTGRLEEVDIYDDDTVMLGIQYSAGEGHLISRATNFELFVREISATSISSVSTAKTTFIYFDRGEDSQKSAIKTIKNMIDYLGTTHITSQQDLPWTRYDNVHHRGVRSHCPPTKKEFFFKELLEVKDG